MSLYEDIKTELDNATLTHISSGNLQPLFNEYHSAGKHDRGPLFLHNFHLDSSEVV